MNTSVLIGLTWTQNHLATPVTGCTTHVDNPPLGSRLTNAASHASYHRAIYPDINDLSSTAGLSFRWKHEPTIVVTAKRYMTRQPPLLRTYEQTDSAGVRSLARHHILSCRFTRIVVSQQERLRLHWVCMSRQPGGCALINCWDSAVPACWDGRVSAEEMRTVSARDRRERQKHQTSTSQRAVVCVEPRGTVLISDAKKAGAEIRRSDPRVRIGACSPTTHAFAATLRATWPV
ncbi:hypothetical protein QBC39DRAFT_154805 [Podospora conica]|nr:hypothetical protein QBC39DRAFT_154805 [Schizothecium conicum]